MDTKSRRLLALFAIAALALALTLLISGGEPARAMFQASPIESPTLAAPTATLPPPGTEQPADPPFPTLEPPTSVPVPPTVGPTPTVRGFLPAPTIVNPNDIQSLPLAQPAVSAGGAAPEPAPTPASTTADPSVRAVVALLNYLWLLCGGALLIGGAVAMILLWRRSQHT